MDEVEVQYIWAKNPLVLNTKVTLAQIKKHCRQFFENGSVFYQNETYTVYRGQLICQIDTEFGQKTVVYLYCSNGPRLFYLGSTYHGNPEEEMKRAKTAVDETIRTKQYHPYS